MSFGRKLDQRNFCDANGTDILENSGDGCVGCCLLWGGVLVPKLVRRIPSQKNDHRLEKSIPEIVNRCGRVLSNDVGGVALF